MANTVISRPDVFPVGTSVKAYLEAVERDRASRAVAPNSASIETKTVQADGTLTYTTLTAGTQYVLHATVGGVEKFVRVTGSGTATIGLQGVPKPSWRTRREALGLSPA